MKSRAYANVRVSHASPTCPYVYATELPGLTGTPDVLQFRIGIFGKACLQTINAVLTKSDLVSTAFRVETCCVALVDLDLVTLLLVTEKSVGKA